MKLTGKLCLTAVLTLGLLQPGVSAEAAETDFSSNCTKYGVLKPNVNPSFQHMNCLLTNAALAADIPPEVVKAVATQENGKWQQFGIKPVDSGIGLMQVTNYPGYSKEKLKNDVIYNIDAGVKILSKKYDASFPKIRGAGRNIIENWYFPVMAYNGIKPVNSPLIKATGKKNTKAYQEEVFSKIVKDSLLKSANLAQFPFTTADFEYDPTSNQNIVFRKMEYSIKDLHPTVYQFKAGNRVMVTVDSVKVRVHPDTTKSAKNVGKNTVLLVRGNFVYSKNSANQFVWYPVRTADQKIKGYISFAYIKKL
ncbi:transglycosylase SLT domain-containing protein [Bacillus sp. SJS]|uniref:transglycosylase SLT domain-containing protein n=1 Tax=Bacillus sp. SJS TaxID=1423321 RepID=UPI000A97A69A|nr:transglycosylase SLT domain-containing protein [Bacillus sp. SJS]